MGLITFCFFYPERRAWLLLLFLCLALRYLRQQVHDVCVWVGLIHIVVHEAHVAHIAGAFGLLAFHRQGLILPHSQLRSLLTPLVKFSLALCGPSTILKPAIHLLIGKALLVIELSDMSVCCKRKLDGLAAVQAAWYPTLCHLKHVH
jgi:hypothetical protein